MLSPGKYHLKVPKSLRENLKFRRYVIESVRKDQRLRKGLIEACRRDLLFFVSVFIWQYNANLEGNEVGPFITWDFQDGAFLEILECIEERQDLCVEKSREMGASWMFLIVMLWMWLFHPWKQFLMVSRSAEAVDCESPDSLFWKLDFMLRHLPDWMKPVMKRRVMFYGNEGNGSTITGQASTGKAGVGGRATAMFVDEFSQIREDFEVLHRTADTTRCRLFNFTHTGIETAAYELTTRENMRILRLHWSMHPEKNKGLYRWNGSTQQVDRLDKDYFHGPDFNFVMDGTPGGPYTGLRSPWYDNECKRRVSSRAIAMDLDIDPKGSMSQFFDQVMIRQLQATYACEPYWEGELQFDRDTGQPKELVPRKDGLLRLWVNLNKDGRPPMDRYGMGADLAAGTGATPSCISIISATTGEKVAEYANAHIDPKDLAPMAVALCWLFKSMDGEGASFCWEMQGPGLVFGKRVVELGYRNIYFRTHENALKMIVSDTPGWYPMSANRRIVFEEYRSALMTRQLVNRSWLALEECRSFKYTAKGDIEHAASASKDDPTGATINHGDRVVADALAWKQVVALGRPGKAGVADEVKPGSILWRRAFNLARRRTEEAWA